MPVLLAEDVRGVPHALVLAGGELLAQSADFVSEGGHARSIQRGNRYRLKDHFSATKPCTINARFPHGSRGKRGKNGQNARGGPARTMTQDAASPCLTCRAMVFDASLLFPTLAPAVFQNP